MLAEITDQYGVQRINWDTVTFETANTDTDSIALFDVSDTGRRLKAGSSCFIVRLPVCFRERLCCLFCNLTFPVRFIFRTLFGCCIAA